MASTTTTRARTLTRRQRAARIARVKAIVGLGPDEVAQKTEVIRKFAAKTGVKKKADAVWRQYRTTWADLVVDIIKDSQIIPFSAFFKRKGFPILPLQSRVVDVTATVTGVCFQMLPFPHEDTPANRAKHCVPHYEFVKRCHAEYLLQKRQRQQQQHEPTRKQPLQQQQQHTDNVLHHIGAMRPTPTIWRDMTLENGMPFGVLFPKAMRRAEASTTQILSWWSLLVDTEPHTLRGIADAFARNHLVNPRTLAKQRAVTALTFGTDAERASLAQRWRAAGDDVDAQRAIVPQSMQDAQAQRTKDAQARRARIAERLAQRAAKRQAKEEAQAARQRARDAKRLQAEVNKVQRAVAKANACTQKKTKATTGRKRRQQPQQANDLSSSTKRRKASSSRVTLPLGDAYDADDVLLDQGVVALPLLPPPAPLFDNPHGRYEDTLRLGAPMQWTEPEKDPAWLDSLFCNEDSLILDKPSDDAGALLLPVGVDSDDAVPFPMV